MKRDILLKGGVIMSKLRSITGILPSVCVVYTDETCTTIDEKAYRAHLRHLLTMDLGAVVCGGHAGETECMTMEERLKVIKIVKEEVKGKVPVVGGVIADGTKEAIEQGRQVKSAGVDAVLFCEPAIIGWDRETSGVFLVEHIVRFDEEVDIPMILFGAPNPWCGGTYNVSAKTFKEIARRVENVVACKITGMYDMGAWRDAVAAFRSVRPEIGCLSAGSANFLALCMYGADGTLSGAHNFEAEDDIALLKAVKSGNYKEAVAIRDKMEPVMDVVYGSRAGLCPTYFHYRYKVAAWLLGYIPRPHMRLPQVPISEEEVEILRQALIKAGKKVVRKTEPFSIAKT